MKISSIIGFLSFFLALSACQKLPMPKNLTYDEYPVYDGDDLGLRYSAEKSVFKVWAPSASDLKIKIYDKVKHLE